MQLLLESAKAEEAINSHNPIYSQISSSYSNAKIVEGAAKSKLKDICSLIEKINYARSHFHALCSENDKSDKAVLVVLEDQTRHCLSEIEGLKDQAKAIEMMDTLSKRIRFNKEKREQLSKVIVGLESETSFLDGLSASAASILVSLNQDFARLSFTPTLDQKIKIESFSTLFSLVDGRLYFCESPLMKTEYFERNNELLKQKHLNEISLLDDNIDDDEKNLIRLKKNCELSKDRQAARLAECISDLGELNHQKNALMASGELESMRLKSEEELGMANAKLEQVSSEMELAKAKREDLNASHSLINSEIASYTLPLKQVEEYINEMKRIDASSSRMLDLNQALFEFNAEHVRNLSVEDIEVSLNSLQTELSDAQRRRTDSINTMSRLLAHVLICT